MATYLITTQDGDRRRLWQRIFGSDKLPVKTPQPRPMCLEPGKPEVLAYDLDADALHSFQVKRFAAVLARRGNGWTYQDAEHAIRAGWPILAEGTEQVTKKRPSLAFLLRRQLNLLWPTHNGAGGSFV